MECLGFGIILAIAFFAFCVYEWYKDRKKEKQIVKDLYEKYGQEKLRETAVERYVRIPGYYKKHEAVGEIDDITWNDLNMDAVFRELNRTSSCVGEEYLYAMLRSAGKSQEELAHLEELVTYFMDHADERVKLQLCMRELGFMGKYSLYDYLDHLDYLGNPSNKKAIICDLLFLPLIGLLFVNTPLAAVLIVILAVYNILTYYREKSEIEPYIVSFVYIIKLIHCAEKVLQLPISVCEREWEQIYNAKKNVQSLKKGAFWVMHGNYGASGNPLDCIFDYMRMLFHIDIIRFNRMLKTVKDHREQIDAIVTNLGLAESAVAIGAFRMSREGKYCVPEFVDEKKIEILEGYHPLLHNPVTNDIRESEGVLLTGSNASGKSTFLRMVAINALLAQTIHTCTASKYTGALFRICSSMALKDDLESGESYYIAEIKSLKRILELDKTEPRPILCFVDEVLRGTNTVERIAAATQILCSLSKENYLCFAATHDIELTRLLEKHFSNYHFEEEVRDGDMTFPYKLREGRATSRNAIQLLQIMGYEEQIIANARSMADRFVAGGEWSLS